jgi:hypothetical protein
VPPKRLPMPCRPRKGAAGAGATVVIKTAAYWMLSAMQTGRSRPCPDRRSSSERGPHAVECHASVRRPGDVRVRNGPDRLDQLRQSGDRRRPLPRRCGGLLRGLGRLVSRQATN